MNGCINFVLFWKPFSAIEQLELRTHLFRTRGLYDSSLLILNYSNPVVVCPQVLEVVPTIGSVCTVFCGWNSNNNDAVIFAGFVR